MRKPAFIILLFVILLTAAACGNTNKPDGQSGSEGSGNAPSPSPSIETVATEEPSQTPTPTDEPTMGAEPVNPIKIYYANTELEKLITKEVKVEFDSGEDLIKKALDALKQDGPDGTVSLWKPIPIKSVTLKDNAVTIDIELPDAARLGAPGEQMLLDSLGQTLFQFDFVQSYDLLVDGQALESLMGHFDLDHPTVRPTSK
ncbi:GerMN domain-containing protein [Paenibacillus glycanilyticus]|uniref:GerMN domain-containing protein n=1 Tax=Paenibacillus glycanilyticus TaxID=126569 RepID=UPI00203B568A|nr:GerMN domain-containing protein [Paenibacillus glycanilyticus]MCM3627525.1 GerMN domain-containing protein [Paenibacillus glycanilyticus]